MRNSAILVDTHIALWIGGGRPIGSKTAILLQSTQTVYISGISLLEIQMKIARNKLPSSLGIDILVEKLDLTVLDYSQKHASSYKIFNPDNRDPFDNAIIASAVAEDIPLITADRHILALQKELSLIKDARK